MPTPDVGNGGSKRRSGDMASAKGGADFVGSFVMTLDVYGHLFRDGGDRTELAEASRLLLA
jgi:hypothetical protein